MVSALLCYFRCDLAFSSVLPSLASSQQCKFCHCLRCCFRNLFSPHLEGDSKSMLSKRKARAKR